MNNGPTSEPVWIDRVEPLRLMVANLKRYPRLAVDTESNSLHAYKERVCLIQFSTGEADYLVDPLALNDLSSLGPIFADPGIEKIFHAAEYDLICLKRDYCFSFHNIFDTMLASRIIGRTEVGLGSMLKSEFGIRIDKRYQRADWARRPLPAEWQAYARLDTFYLFPLRDRLYTELVKKERLALAQEDFERMCHVSGQNGENGVNSCWKISGSRDLSPKEAAVLSLLCNFREDQARQKDCPTFKIMNNDTLLQLAIEQPQSLDALAGIRGVPQWLIKSAGGRLIEIIRRGQNAQPLPRPASQPRPNEDYLTRLEALRTWRKQTGEKMGVPSDVILPRDTMEEIARANPPQMEDLNSLMQNLAWRFKHFGADIFSLIHS